MKLKLISLLTLVILLTFIIASPAMALTSDPIAFDQIWSELSILDETERANFYAEWLSQEPYPVTAPIAQTASSIALAGDIEEHSLSLPATETPWLITIENFNLYPSDPNLVQIQIIDKPSGEGNISVKTPNDFMDQGGNITVDPYSYPPQINISSSSAQPLYASQFIINITAPVDSVIARASLPLYLSDFQGSRLDLDLQGDYHLDLQNIQLEELKLGINGSGKLKLSGYVNYASLNLMGTLEFDSTELVTKKLHSRLAGSISARFGEGEQSILEVRGMADISPPSGDLIRLGD